MTIIYIYIYIYIHNIYNIMLTLIITEPGVQSAVVEARVEAAGQVKHKHVTT